MSYIARRLFCPRCGFEFDPLYSMVIFDARIAFLKDRQVRCPKCDFEFKTTPQKVQAVRALSTRRPLFYP